jgi:ABC-2 type transport system ATP-binding protein
MVIRARAIEVRYQRGGALAVSGVNLDLRAGSGLLITGDRGSGKSSVLRAVLGLAGPGGDITVLGAPPGDPGTLRRIGWAPQSWPFGFGLRAREVVDMVATLGGHEPGEAAAAIEEAGVEEPDRRVEALEIEDVRRTSLACALIGEPDLLVLDDPWEWRRHQTPVASPACSGPAST